MKITHIEKLEAFIVHTDDNEKQEYTRYSAESWTLRIGDSDEPVYDSSKIEKLFQKFKAAQDQQMNYDQAETILKFGFGRR